MNNTLQSGYIQRGKSFVLLQAAQRIKLFLQSCCAVTASFYDLRGVCQIIRQLITANDQRFFFPLIVPAHYIAPCIIHIGAVILFMTIPVFYQPVNGDGFIIALNGFFIFQAYIRKLLHDLLLHPVRQLMIRVKIQLIIHRLVFSQRWYRILYMIVYQPCP